MTTWLKHYGNKTAWALRSWRLLLGVLLLCVLQACNSGAAREAEMAAAEAARIAAEQEAAQLAAEQARMRAQEEERQRQARLAEQARMDAERARQEEIARAQAEQERQRQAAEQARQDAIARAQTERRQKLARISQLENQIASLETDIANGNNANERYREAIMAAEELLEVLTSEQPKYDNVDANGIPVEPLAKDVIADLQARRDSLVQAAQASTP